MSSKSHRPELRDEEKHRKNDPKVAILKRRGKRFLAFPLLAPLVFSGRAKGRAQPPIPRHYRHKFDPTIPNSMFVSTSSAREPTG